VAVASTEPATPPVPPAEGTPARETDTGRALRYQAGVWVDHLGDWLEWQYEKAEARARAATPGPWRIGEAKHGLATINGPDALQDGGRDDTTGGRRQVMRPRVVVPPDVDYGPCVDIADAAHIAEHDPKWRLRDIELKRAILAEHEVDDFGAGKYGIPRDEYDPPPICTRCRVSYEAAEWPCRTVRLLAAEFEGADGWREEWRP
jgi:hypothetical protein